MAVPKKRTGHSAQGHRRSNWKANKPEITKCTQCGETALSHTVCTACGFYKDQPVRLKDKAEFVAPVEAKKPAKKATTKVKKDEKAVEAEKIEAKVEEIAAEVENISEEAQAVNKTKTSETIQSEQQKPQ